MLGEVFKKWNMIYLAAEKIMDSIQKQNKGYKWRSENELRITNKMGIPHRNNVQAGGQQKWKHRKHKIGRNTERRKHETIRISQSDKRTEDPKIAQQASQYHCSRKRAKITLYTTDSSLYWFQPARYYWTPNEENNGPNRNRQVTAEI